MQPIQSPITDYVEFTGTTEAAHEVQIRARIQGFVQEICFEDGMDVEQGQVLYGIEPETFEAETDNAVAQREEARAHLVQAEADYTRFSDLITQGVISSAEFDAVRARRDAAREAVNAAEAETRVAERTLSYTEVVAPISGRVGRSLVKVGDLVGAGQPTLLTTVVRYDPMQVYFNVNERDLLDIRDQMPSEASREFSADSGAPIELGLVNEEEYPHRGHLDFADVEVDPQSGTFTVRGVFPNADEALLPGLFARVRIPIRRHESALFIPERAVGTDQLGRYVLVVGPGNVTEQRVLTLGRSRGNLVVVENGLSEDDWFIVDGLQRARAGEPVTPERSAPSEDLGIGRGASILASAE
jgi:RND family efflux transporter MFP subunit